MSKESKRAERISAALTQPTVRPLNEGDFAVLGIRPKVDLEFLDGGMRYLFIYDIVTTKDGAVFAYGRDRDEHWGRNEFIELNLIKTMRIV